MRILIGLLLLICRPFHSSSKINEHQGNQSTALTAVINSPLGACSLASSRSTSLSESSKEQYDNAVSGMSSQEEYDKFEKSTPENLQKEATSRTSSRYPCNIERIDLRILREAADKSGEAYMETVITNLPDHPVIFVGYSDRNALLSRLASMDSLTSSPIGDSEVKLTSSNTYSSGLKTMTLKEYISYTVSESSRWDRDRASAQCDAARGTGPLGSDDSASCKRKSNESFYLFGGNFGGVWDSMRDAYRLPPCLVCAQCGAVTIGIGGHLSGVSFHHHGPGFSEVIEGSKRWFLFPPPSLLPLPLPPLPPSPDQSPDPDPDHDIDTHEGQCTIDGLINKRSRPGVDAGTRETRSRVREMFDPNMTVHEWVEQMYPSYVTHTHHIPSTSAFISSTANQSAVSLHGPRSEPRVEQGQSNSSKSEMETCVGGEGMSVDRHSDTDSDSDRDSSRGRDRGRERRRVEHTGGLQECTTGPGEMLYFPAQWMHATLNMSPYNVFVSLFIDLQLLR